MDVADDLWEALISSIEEGRVVPVVGPELLVVPDGDRQVPLYKLIAERLAAKHGLKPQWRAGAELNDVVCSYLDEKPHARVEELYPAISFILKGLALAPPEPLLMSLAFSSDGGILIAACKDGTPRRYGLAWLRAFRPDHG